MNPYRVFAVVLSLGRTAERHSATLGNTFIICRLRRRRYTRRFDGTLHVVERLRHTSLAGNLTQGARRPRPPRGRRASWASECNRFAVANCKER
jgi:hypothetical protein